MIASVGNPTLNRIVVSQNMKETLMIKGMVAIGYTHYVVYIPLVTQFPLEDFIDEDYGFDEKDIIQPLGVAKVAYNYVTRVARLIPLTIDEDEDTIDFILQVMGYAY
jgi:hypothetical protein